jgi:hypothetical protein
MAFWVVLIIIVLGLAGYVKIFGKKPCGCQDKIEGTP